MGLHVLAKVSVEEAKVGKYVIVSNVNKLFKSLLRVALLIVFF